MGFLKMKRLLITILILFSVFLYSCGGIEYKILKDGWKKVPKYGVVYEEGLSKFNKQVLKLIDTNAVYLQLDIELNILKKDTDKFSDLYYGAYRFYPNGYLNSFGLVRDSAFNKYTFNPDYTGFRGVYYQEDGVIKAQKFATRGELRIFAAGLEEIKVKGDTIYVRKYDNSYRNWYRKYLKVKVADSLINFKVDWANE